jgi:hypothetical protein
MEIGASAGPTLAMEIGASAPGIEWLGQRGEIGVFSVGQRRFWGVIDRGFWFWGPICYTAVHLFFISD